LALLQLPIRRYRMPLGRVNGDWRKRMATDSLNLPVRVEVISYVPTRYQH